MIDRRTLHFEDILAAEAEFPEFVSRMRQDGFSSRTMLVTPLLREGAPLGAIIIARPEVHPFSAKQIALLETFANQAVIAIENARLFQELELRNRDLTEALERETATGSILRAIATSPTDPGVVFDAILESALRLCGAAIVWVNLSDGRLVSVAALRGPAALLEAVKSAFPRRLTDPGLTTRAIREGVTVHVADVLEDPASLREIDEVSGVRAELYAPMLREGRCIGAQGIGRDAPGLFSEAQVALVHTLADQAAIAVENVRLFKELEARNRDLSEALEQQTATSEILRVISGSPTDIQPVLDAVAESAGRLCEAYDVTIFRVDGDALRLAAHHGPIPPGPIGHFLVPLIRGTTGGRAVLDRQTIHVADLQGEVDEFPEGSDIALRLGHRTVVTVPLLKEATAIGVIHLRRSEVFPFTQKQIALLQTFADQAVIAIENVRLFKELEARNRDLTESLEQQTATAEILRVIASSPTDLQPVMEAVAENAARVCGATDSSIFRLEGKHLRLVARHGTLRRSMMVGGTVPVGRDTVTGRVVIERRTIHVEDIEAAAADFPLTVSRHIQAGSAARTVLATPLLREGTPLGVIFIVRGPEVHPFSAKQIALLETFANQAVIAIENVRLFQELRTRTAELTRSVEQLTALGEVSRAVSSTLDLDRVLDTIVTRANQLAGTDGCTIFEYDEAAEVFRLRASRYTDPREAAALDPIGRATPIPRGQGLAGRAALLREPVHISDISVGGTYESPVREPLLRAGYRALLGVPLLREEQVIGVLSVLRKTPGDFAPEVVRVLMTFATQSALAIENARLFREIADKSQQLESASRHKSEFLANMSHELRTPLNAILRFNEMILGEVYGSLTPDLREPLTDIQNSGRHLLRLINNVLDLSKIEAGRMELALTDYAVQDVVERVRASLHSLAAEKGLELVAAIPADIPLAYGDAGRITQCLMNLAGNALKFTRQGRVGIAVELQDDRLVYRVADTGIGIAKDKLETVFAEFRQGDATITSSLSST